MEEYKDVGCVLEHSCMDCTRICYLLKHTKIPRRNKDKKELYHNSITKLRDAGLDPRAISERLGISKNVVYKHISVWKPKLSKKLVVLGMLREGVDRREISNETGISVSYIRLIEHKFIQP